MSLIDRIFAARGLDGKLRADFLTPDYSAIYNPFLLPDMLVAVDRIVLAYKNQENIAIYGDYDIDGLTATSLLLDAFKKFGFKCIKTYIPSRFTDGYGLTIDAIKKIIADGAGLLITVDCGSQNKKEIIKANQLGLDVIVTDHHNLDISLPPAIAVINPKRVDSVYPFNDLAGVGVAFKLVQALQTKLTGLPKGQEKWLLDLVALGTVCDIVTLVDENRINVFWGLKVFSKTKRTGLKALMTVSRIDPKNINVKSLGFGLGPRMNAAGRLETAQRTLDMLLTDNPIDALEKAQYLDELNLLRRSDQNKIFSEAVIQAEKYRNDPVIVVSDKNWNHGIVGIVASKLLEKYKKPSFVIQEIGDESKGSARSYGDFSVAAAVQASMDIITKGGGHNLAAGVTLPTKNINAFRQRVNDLYKSQRLTDQEALLLPKADTYADFNELTEELFYQINQFEPFGNGNLQPILKTENLLVMNVRKMGADSRHVKMDLKDKDGQIMQFLAFNAPEYFFIEPGTYISVWYNLEMNEWQGHRTIEGKLLHIEEIN
jgi:single-stranded-DNA-specific exonuclease